MTKTLYGLLVLASFWSCGYDEGITPSSFALTAVEIPLQPEQIPRITRATDENIIQDVNFYVIGKGYKEMIHGYQQSPNLRFECPPGDYDIYIMTNVHSDMGEKTALELASYNLSYHDNYADLPM